MNNYFPTAIGGKESEVQKPQKIYRKDIQALRGIAVLLVVLNHVAPNAITNGQIGVDIFFVISGFVISQSLDNSIGRRQPVKVLKSFIAREQEWCNIKCLPINNRNYANGLLPMEDLMADALFGMSNILFQLTTQDYFKIDSRLNPFLAWPGVKQFYAL